MFKISTASPFHRFATCRDAIEAVSAFEAENPHDTQYNIKLTSFGEWFVMCCDEKYQVLGHLAPL